MQLFDSETSGVFIKMLLGPHIDNVTRMLRVAPNSGTDLQPRQDVSHTGTAELLPQRQTTLPSYLTKNGCTSAIDHQHRPEKVQTAMSG